MRRSFIALLCTVAVSATSVFALASPAAASGITDRRAISPTDSLDALIANAQRHGGEG
jgi:hypothetical protein